MILSVKVYDHHSLSDVTKEGLKKDFTCILHVVGRVLKINETFLVLCPFETIGTNSEEITASEYDVNVMVISAIVGAPICYKEEGDTDQDIEDILKKLKKEEE